MSQGPGVGGQAPDPIAVLLVVACTAGTALQAVQELDADTLFFLRYFTCVAALMCGFGCLLFRRWRVGAFVYLCGIVGVLCSGIGWWFLLIANFSIVPRTVLEQASMYSLHVLVPCGAAAHVLFGAIPRKLPVWANLATLLVPVVYGALTLGAQVYLGARAPYGFLDVKRLGVAGGLEFAGMFGVFWLVLTCTVVWIQSVRRRWWSEQGVEEIPVSR